jgi:hypothetical protein
VGKEISAVHVALLESRSSLAELPPVPTARMADDAALARLKSDKAPN